MIFFQNKTIIPLLAVQLFILSGCFKASDNEVTAPPAEKPELVILEQGWNSDERVDFYNTSQGSQLIPYAWFLALEQSDSELLFRADDNIGRLGYIPQQPVAGRNPDGLPVGFVKDDTIDPLLVTKISTSRLSSETGALQSEYREWLGLTCAACHTSEIQLDKHRLRIDGGPPLSDFQSFIEGLSKALQITVENDDKLTRFAKKVLAQGGYSEGEKQRLQQELSKFITWLDNYIEINYDGLTTAYGYGRLDAFGAILNQVTTSFTGIESNSAPANAPVSYPYLWNTSQLSWVQWNGSANNHIGRNVGEVLGVFAHTIVKTSDPTEMFLSSAKIINLDRLENLMSQLDSPKWQSPLPPIDQGMAAKGKILFAENCVFCHGIRNDDGQFPMTNPNPVGKQFIKVNMIALNKIGTDPLMAMNFITPALNVDPGVVRQFLPDKYQNEAKVPRAVMLSAVVKSVIGKQVLAFSPPLDQQQLLELTGYHLPEDKGGRAPPNLIAYKARPLNGIWATAPYLHNGSVSSLYQLLLPDSKREKSFDVGGKELDVKNVGFLPSKTGNHFKFNTVDTSGMPIPGNGNYGHSGKSHTTTREENGLWRDFTNGERYQLIEYLKTL
jgi:hypothetical protein